METPFSRCYPLYAAEYCYSSVDSCEDNTDLHYTSLAVVVANAAVVAEKTRIRTDQAERAESYQ